MGLGWNHVSTIRPIRNSNAMQSKGSVSKKKVFHRNATKRCREHRHVPSVVTVLIRVAKTSAVSTRFGMGDLARTCSKSFPQLQSIPDRLGLADRQDAANDELTGDSESRRFSPEDPMTFAVCHEIPAHASNISTDNRHDHVSLCFICTESDFT